jgi:hypothetical protein
MGGFFVFHEAIVALNKPNVKTNLFLNKSINSLKPQQEETFVSKLEKNVPYASIFREMRL